MFDIYRDVFKKHMDAESYIYVNEILLLLKKKTSIDATQTEFKVVFKN